jgi:hypothetical protein
MGSWDYREQWCRCRCAGERPPHQGVLQPKGTFRHPAKFRSRPRFGAAADRQYCRHIPGQGIFWLVFEGSRGSHHIAVQVAAGPQGRPQATDNRRNGRLEILLQNAMELKPLPGRGPHGVVAILIGQRSRVRYNSGGITHPDCGCAASSGSLFLPFDPVIAVVLLVRPVKLKDLNSIFGEVGGIFQQFTGQRFAKKLLCSLIPLAWSASFQPQALEEGLFAGESGP